MLREGASVIVDASFSSSRWRDAARTVATQTSSGLVELRCVLRHDLVVDRLTERAGRGDASDADVDIAVALSRAFEPWPTATVIDTGPPRAVVTAQAQRVIAPERG
jgi:predicted kinase